MDKQIQDRKRSSRLNQEEKEIARLPNNSSHEFKENVKTFPILIPTAANIEYLRSPQERPHNLSEESFSFTEDFLEPNDQRNDSDANDDSRYMIFDMTLDSSSSIEYATEITSTKTPNNSIMAVKENEIQRKSESQLSIHFPENDNSSEMVDKKIPTVASFWLDMSKESKNNPNLEIKKSPNKSDQNTSEKNELVSKTNKENDKSLGLGDSENDGKLCHSFYVDLNTLPDPLLTNRKNEAANVNEKDNMFTMYIDIGESSASKGKPPKLESTIAKKTFPAQSKFPNKNSVKRIGNVKRSNSNLTTFEKIESLCNDPNVSLSEIRESLKDPCANPETEPYVSVEICKNKHPQKVLINNKKTVIPTVVIKGETTSCYSVREPYDTFVKLSDLDKPVTKSTDINSVQTEASLSKVFHENKIWDTRMTRSIPDNTSDDYKSSWNSIVSSFHSENALSLNRLFPNLLNKFNKTVPVCSPSKTRSILETSSTGTVEDMQLLNTSETSSLQSSVYRSIVEISSMEDSNQISSIISSCQSRLGQDLLRMFLQEIATDVIVEVKGKRIKAHKCILSSRCQFFAGMLSGGYVESAGNVIVLPSFSYDVVHFALCHIYAGISEIPDSIRIIELATLADMLGLEGLKEAIMFTLKAKYCHNFHKPCSVCIAGVLQCFPVSSLYGLDYLYLKCLKWITKHYVKVWPTKAFATLPTELLEKCYQQQTVNFTTESFVETVYGYGLTMASLHNSRWGEILVRMCRRLIHAASLFAAMRLVDVLKTIEYVSATVSPPALQALEECLSAAIDWAPPELTCRAYAFLSNIIQDVKRQQQSPKPDEVNANGNPSGPNSLLYYRASIWRLQCEGALVRAAPRVVTTKAFQELPSELKKRLRELGCISFVSQAKVSQNDKIISTKSKNVRSHSSSSSRNLDLEHVRSVFVPYSTKPVIPPIGIDRSKYCNDTKDLKQSRSTQPPKVRMTKAQEQRAKYNTNKHIQPCEQVNRKLFAAKTHLPNKYNEKISNAFTKLSLKTMSSSESSQNSSPKLVRRFPVTGKQQKFQRKTYATSQDNLVTSSRPRTTESSIDSLNESKNGTDTNVKNIIRDSNENVKSAKCCTVTRVTELNGKNKTRIPVNINNKHKSYNKPSTASSQRYGNPPIGANAVAQDNALGLSCGKPRDRRAGGSLMDATKSSLAKKVPKMIKGCSKNNNLSKMSNKEDKCVPPKMSRSGTFLMDQPSTSFYIQ